MRRCTNHNRYVMSRREPTHVVRWSELLGVSEDALLEAIERVSNDDHAIEDYLSIRRPQSCPRLAVQTPYLAPERRRIEQ